MGIVCSFILWSIVRINWACVQQNKTYIEKGLIVNKYSHSNLYIVFVFMKYMLIYMAYLYLYCQYNGVLALTRGDTIYLYVVYFNFKFNLGF